jgi:hypothetical protein
MEYQVDARNGMLEMEYEMEYKSRYRSGVYRDGYKVIRNGIEMEYRKLGIEVTK